jgi:hypothetical protein
MNDMDLERPLEGPPDETDISLRAYFARMPIERLQQYDPQWSDEQTMAWDGNFRCDGALMLVCCERDVQIDEYRQVLQEHLRRCGIGSDAV